MFFIIFIIFFGFTNAQESCKTPTNLPGECIILKECEFLYNKIAMAGRNIKQNENNYIRKSWCGVKNRQHKICCPIANHIRTTSVTSKTTDVQVISHPNMHLLPNSICGIIDESDRMVGANLTELFENPWMVIIEYEPKNDLKLYCGGTIINKRYILTAAHCLTGNNKPISVVVGEHNTTSEIDCVSDTDDDCAPEPVTIQIEEILIHEKFHSYYLTNDIGLIRVTQDIDFTADSVGPICLPISLQSLEFKFHKVKVTGWGKTENQIRSDILLQAFLNIVPNDICVKKYPPRVKITNQQMCAGGLGADSCNEDSGGPAIIPTTTPYGLRFVQLGIVSAGQSICGSGTPGLYTKVGPYINWILDTIKS